MRVIQVKPVHVSICASIITDGFHLNNPHRFMVSSVNLFITPCNPSDIFSLHMVGI
jgi:hypothetical protein